MALRKEDITKDKIKIVEMFGKKMFGQIETEVPYNQSAVFLVDGKQEELAGFYLHIPKKWSGNSNWPNQFNTAMEQALRDSGKEVISSIEAPVSLNQLQKSQGVKA